MTGLLQMLISGVYLLCMSTVIMASEYLGLIYSSLMLKPEPEGLVILTEACLSMTVFILLLSTLHRSPGHIGRILLRIKCDILKLKPYPL